MKSINFDEFKKAVGQSFITLKSHNFPRQGWCKKTIGNVIYIWSKPSVELMRLYEVEKKTGKQVLLCVVPKAIISHVGI
jgi:hypothetical protein